MADNQHRQIKGYRDFDQGTIDDINQLKETERAVLADLKALAAKDADPRWLAIARTDIQKGFMAAIRSVAKPEE